MSRTFPRAAGAIPGKLVSRMTLIAAEDDTERFSRRMRRILAQRLANSKRMSGGFLCKTFCHGFAANRKKERNFSAPRIQKLWPRSGRSRGEFFGRRLFFTFPANADDFRNARFLHGDAVEDAADFHRFAVVGDDDELRLRAHVVQKSGKAPDVCFVKRRVHFVEDAERAWLIAEDCDEQSQSGHRLFATGKQ